MVNGVEERAISDDESVENGGGEWWWIKIKIMSNTEKKKKCVHK